jgi:hypothetical protein
MLEPSLIIRKLLTNSSAVTHPDDQGIWPAFAGHMPDDPNDLVTIYDTAGVVHHKASDKTVAEHYGFEVHVRCRDKADGWLKMSNIIDVLDRVHNTDASLSNEVYTVVNVQRTSTVIPLGLETGTNKRRFGFTCNFLVAIN